MFAVTISKIVGAAKHEHWSQVHTFKPSDKKLFSLGQLFLVVELSALESSEDAALDMPSFGKEVIQRFHEQYYGVEEKDKSAFDRLAEAMGEVSREFDQVASQLVAGVVLPTKISGKLGVLYLAGIGSGSAMLLRDGRLYRVLVSGRSKEAHGSGEVVTVSGFMHDDDVLVLGTGEFFNLVSPAIFKKALLLHDPPEISSALALYVHGSEDSSGMAAVIVKIGKELRPVTVSETGREEIEAAEALETVAVEEPEVQGGFFGLVKGGVRGGWSRVIRGAGRLRGRPTATLMQEPGEIVVRGEESRRRRLMFSIAFSLLILLGISILFGWRRRVEKEREQAFLSVWEVAEHQYKEARELLELNPLRSRALLLEAKQQIDEVLSDTETAYSREQRQRLSDRLEEISSMLERVSGEYRIEEARVFLDLELVRPNSYAEALGLHEDTLVVLDRVSGVLLRVGVANKSADPVGGGVLLSGASVAAVYAGRGFVVSESGVVEVSLTGKTSAVVVETDPEWKEIVDIKVFGGNIYLLDQGNGEIFRYQGVEGGFGPRYRWLGEGVTPDLSEATSMAIDGDIWVLKSDTILRFRRGVPEAFNISGLDLEFSNPLSIYTDDESERVYILDRGNRRVVVLDKSGEYREQYLWEGIETVSSLVVSEDERKILLLSGSMIYEIEIRG